MCGIGGYIDNTVDQYKGKSILEKMGRVMQYRGPESTQIHAVPNGGFVHNRLKIIDLSDRANQPMKSACENFLLVFNGEIYNYKQLQEYYKIQNLKTESDTEVLLECLAKNPIEEVLQKTQGMFAFVLYNLHENKIELARDRFGQKPLYYYLSENQFYFCSDIRGLGQNISNLTIDFQAVDYYLSELVMPQPNTVYAEIKQLPPGKIGTIEDFNIEFKSFYNFKLSKPVESFSEEEWLNKIEECLISAASARMISDVDLGFFLSGGVDSGLIVALMSQATKKPLDTYTAVYDEKDFDERKYARDLAERYNTNHHEIKIDSSHIDEILLEVLNEAGEPFADSSLLPSYFVSKEMSKHVTVAVSGDGGDESFGYPEYGYMLKLEDFKKKGKLQQDLSALYAKISNRLGRNNSAMNAAYNYSLKNEMNGEFLDRKMGFSAGEKGQLYQSDKLKGIHFNKQYHQVIWSGIETEELFAKKRIGGFKTRLLNDYLVKVDRSSMFNSLEVRSPFLDHKLVDLAAQIPPELHFKNNQPKYLLKKLAEKHIDPAITERKKMGFGIPVTHWIKNELKSFTEKYLAEERLMQRGWFSPEFVKNLIEEHLSGKVDHRHKIWSLLCLEIWLEQNLE